MLWIAISIIVTITIIAIVKIKYPFWNIQPVFHAYDFWKYFYLSSFVIYKKRPAKTKYCKFENVKTVSFYDLTEEKYDDFLSLLQNYYLSAENVLFTIYKNTLQHYFIGYMDTPYISFYYDISSTTNTYYTEDNNSKHNDIIGCISSRPMHIVLQEKRTLFKNEWSHNKCYFIDFLCEKRNAYIRQKSSPIITNLLQTHEYNQRLLNPAIQISLLRKEIDLYKGVIPLIAFHMYLFHCKTIATKQQYILPKTVHMIKMNKENFHLLDEFMRHFPTKNFDCMIFPDIPVLKSMIENKLLHVFCLKPKKDLSSIYALYFFKNEYTYYDVEHDQEFDEKNGNTFHCIGSLNNGFLPHYFITGFFHVIKYLLKREQFQFLLFDNVGDNVKLLYSLQNQFQLLTKHNVGYYTFNFIYPSSPIKEQNGFILI